MSDADHTVDADEIELERLRRLVVDQPSALPSTPRSDLTIEAAPDTFERLRRIATGDNTSRGGTPAAFPPPDAFAAAVDPTSPAPKAAATAPPAPPTPPVMSQRLRRLPTGPSLRSTPAEPTPPPRVEPAVGPAWVPPPRSMRPEPEVVTEAPSVRRWRLATMMLAVALVVLLLGWAVFGRNGLTEPPTDSVPTGGVPAATTPASSVTEAPSSTTDG